MTFAQGGSRPEHGRSKTIVTSCCFLQRCQIVVFFLRSFLFFALYSLLNNAARVVRSAASGCWAAHWLLKRSLVGLLKLTRLEVRPVIAIIGRFSSFFFSSLTLFRLFYGLLYFMLSRISETLRFFFWEGCSREQPHLRLGRTRAYRIQSTRFVDNFPGLWTSWSRG